MPQYVCHAEFAIYWTFVVIAKSYWAPFTYWEGFFFARGIIGHSASLGISWPDNWYSKMSSSAKRNKKILPGIILSGCDFI